MPLDRPAAGIQPAETLPRLLYLADTPVEQSCHGSALVYRLLSEYPADRLRIIEVGEASIPSRRLANRDYHYCPQPRMLLRALNTRFRQWAEFILARVTTVALSRVDKIAAEFQPESVLTVMHGYGWMKAFHIANALNLPAHCIVHDDLPTMFGSRCGPYIARRFEECYVAATSRYCVSTAMAEEYQKRYGCHGDVLLPSRATGVSGSLTMPVTGKDDGPITVAFAGSVNGQGYAEALRHLAECLAEQDGRLFIYGPLTESAAVAAGLQLPNVTLRGMIPSEKLVETLQRDVDVVFVPMSFAPGDRINMTIAFPSKLTDCTLTGLPLLIYGPEYCSAVRFAKDNSGLGEVVTTNDPVEMHGAIKRLENPLHRAALGESSVFLGNHYFSLDSSLKQFYTGLNRKSLVPRTGPHNRCSD